VPVEVAPSEPREIVSRVTVIESPWKRSEVNIYQRPDTGSLSSKRRKGRNRRVGIVGASA
jgi:hypothetical protein